MNNQDQPTGQGQHCKCATIAPMHERKKAQDEEGGPEGVPGGCLDGKTAFSGGRVHGRDARVHAMKRGRGKRATQRICGGVLAGSKRGCTEGGGGAWASHRGVYKVVHNIIYDCHKGMCEGYSKGA